MRRACVLAVLVLLGVNGAFGQSSPEGVVSEYLERVATSGFFGAVTAYMHPDDLLTMKREMVRALSRRPATEIEDIFGFGTTSDDLIGMMPEDFLEKVFAFLPSDVPLDEPLGFSAHVDVLGVVPEGDVQHVVARITITTGSSEFSQVQLTSVRRYEDQWRISMPADTARIVGLFDDVLRAGL